MASSFGRKRRSFAHRSMPAGVLAACAALFAVAQPSPARAGEGCRYPFVWREAFPGDHVCVVPRTRSQAAADNAVAAERVNPTNHDYGPDTCRYGYVWREARPSDHVCVIPRIRSEAARDNAEAAGRFADGAPPRRPTAEAIGCCPQSMLVCPLGRRWCR